MDRDIIFRRIKEKIQKNTFLFIILKQITAHTVYFLNKISNYKLEKIRFYKKTGYKPNLKNPTSFNEKIFWKKIYDRNPLLPLTTDKYLVRNYVKEILGEKTAKDILIPLLYVTDKPEAIPFEQLSFPYIIKANHTSGNNIIVRDSQFDKKKVINVCHRWLKTPFGLEKLEWTYQPIKRKIVIEKLLLDENGQIPKDYKFHMFHGECVYLVVILDRRENISALRLDKNWNLITSFFVDGFPTKELKIEKPKNYEMMLDYAGRLSKPFDYVRVDFYNIDGHIYFGELTHYPGSGTSRYEPVFFDYELGKHWRVEPEYWKQK